MTATAPRRADAGPSSPFLGLRVVLVAPGAPPASGAATEASVLHTRLAAEGADVVRVVPNPSLPAAYDRVPWVRLLRFRRELRRALAGRPDVVHVHGAAGEALVRVVAFALDEARRCGARAVVRWDDGAADEFLAREGPAARRILGRADAVVVPTAWTRDVLLRRTGVAASVAPHAVEETSPDPPPSLDSGRLRLLCARRLEPGSGVDVVLAAAARAAREGADFVLRVAGDGSARREVEAGACRDLGDRVRFLGAVPHDRFVELLRESDAIVNGTTADDVPVALVEALAAGVPALTSAAGGIPEIVEHGATGLVTAPGDVDALAGSILRVAHDRDLLVALGWRAKAESLRWTWDVLREPWAAAYGVAAEASS